MNVGLIEQGFAAAGLLACVALLVHRALRPAHRQRLRAWLRALPRWRETRANARREAEEAIARARRAGPPVEREGNVYRPRSFTDPSRKKPPLH